MKTLLAIDGSQGSHAVIQEAITRQWPAESSFCVLSIVDLNHWDGMPELIEDAHHAANTLVQKAVAQMRAAGLNVVSEVRMGFPQRAINKYAAEWQANLIMVGSRGLSEITRFLLGSVAQSVLRDAPCSVEIVRPPSPQALAGLPTKILLATDGSECSAKAVQAIANCPWTPGTEVQIVSAVQLAMPEIPAVWSPPNPQYSSGLLNEVWKEAEVRAYAAITDARKVLEKAGLNISQSHAPAIGEPRSVILDQASAWGANLIVVGSHGKHGLDRMLMGSVSEAVALHAHCSVEIFRAEAPIAAKQHPSELSLVGAA
jgi:nucleotide-binding universal stress UspA family protein